MDLLSSRLLSLHSFEVHTFVEVETFVEVGLRLGSLVDYRGPRSAIHMPTSSSMVSFSEVVRADYIATHKEYVESIVALDEGIQSSFRAMFFKQCKFSLLKRGTEPLLRMLPFESAFTNAKTADEYVSRITNAMTFSMCADDMLGCGSCCRFGCCSITAP